VAAALSEAPEPYPGALILERHGAVAVGAGPAIAGDGGDATAARIAGLGQAVDRLELVEVLARAWRDMIVLRAASGAGYPSRP